ncbi:DUF2185 domain-containing protein [Chitinophaga sp. GCM10012297]|uniref:DUF2185 domain-containing protein n=1 Tax=Chitinophaga chungangae TaxID=2821488 RepID=A0ABS3YBA0_9BACT|nr:DUF2185 domain-containing protein [Chitinophaga chungangae]MBO9151949.1 DUF2185 domain-containing protein [Chitinophaga chungangae]
MEKRFKLRADQIVTLIPNMGGCIATDMITVEGKPVGYMYREEPVDAVDSGWCFFSGEEDQDYIDDPNNATVYAVNTIANYDRAIIPYLNLPVGTELERKPGTDTFNQVPG